MEKTSQLKPATLKLVKKHLHNNKIVFREDVNLVDIFLTDSQVRTLLKHEYGKVAKKEFRPKLEELMNTILIEATQSIKDKNEDKSTEA